MVSPTLRDAAFARQPLLRCERDARRRAAPLSVKSQMRSPAASGRPVVEVMSPWHADGRKSRHVMHFAVMFAALLRQEEVCRRCAVA